MIAECIKQGINLANRNLQLVLIRIAVSFINLVAMLIFLGVPIVFAIIYLGMDLSHAGDLIPGIASDPMSFVSRYLGLIFIMGLMLIFYSFFSSLLFIYLLGGTLGILRKSASNLHFRFSLGAFFQEANNNFFRMLWLVSLVVVIILALFLFMIVSGVIVALFMQSSGTGNLIQVFLNSFVAIFVGILCFIIALAGIIACAYSLVVSVVEGKGAVDSIKGAYAFVKMQPTAILFFVILFFIMTIASIIFYGMFVPVHFIPFVGILLNIVMYVVSAFFRGYLTVFLWGALMTYYMRLSNYPADYSEYEI